MNKKKMTAFLLLALSLAALAGLVFFAKGISSGLSGNQSTSKFPVQSQEYMAASDEKKASMLTKAKEAAYKQVNNLWKEKLGAYK